MVVRYVSFCGVHRTLKSGVIAGSSNRRGEENTWEGVRWEIRVRIWCAFKIVVPRSAARCHSTSDRCEGTGRKGGKSAPQRRKRQPTESRTSIPFPFSLALLLVSLWMIPRSRQLQQLATPISPTPPGSLHPTDGTEFVSGL